MDIDDFFADFCTHPVGGKPLGRGVTEHHPRYLRIMQELSDGVMAEHMKRRTYEEDGQRYTNVYPPRLAYFLDCMVGLYGHDPK
eukprot:5907572-Karenia_brevis.AAC.1